MNQVQPHPGIHHADGSEFQTGVPDLTWIDGKVYEWDPVNLRFVREEPVGIYHFIYFYDTGDYLSVTVPGGPVQMGTWT